MADRMADEASFQRRVLDALSTWLAKVRAAVLAAWNRFRGKPDPNGVYVASPLWGRLVDELETHLRGSAAHGAAEVGPKLGDQQFVESQLRLSHNLLTGIPDEVHALIVSEIADAVNSGAKPAEIAARVDALLSTTGSARWTNRANTIAATEVHRMANAGVLGAATALQHLRGKTLYKQWDARHDDRVRAPHHAADGQRVRVNSHFIVGGTPMLYPGDPKAPAELVVNCRCGMSIHDDAKVAA